MPLFGGISAGIALIGLGLSGAQYAKAQKEKKQQDADLAKQRAANQGYATPQSVKDQLADATGRVGAINPALIGAYQQAQQAQANQQGFAQRNASSGAQALAAGAQSQQQTQSILPKISELQTAYDQQNRQNYYGALGATTDDARLKYQDAAQRNQDAQNFSLGRIGAAQQDKSQAIGLGLSALNTAAGAYGQYAKANTGALNTRVMNSQMYEGANPMPQLGLASPGTNAVMPTPQAVTQPTTAGLGQQYTPLQLAYMKRMGYATPSFAY